MFYSAGGLGRLDIALVEFGLRIVIISPYASAAEVTITKESGEDQSVLRQGYKSTIDKSWLPGKGFPRAPPAHPETNQVCRPLTLTESPQPDMWETSSGGIVGGSAFSEGVPSGGRI